MGELALNYSQELNYVIRETLKHTNRKVKVMIISAAEII